MQNFKINAIKEKHNRYYDIRQYANELRIDKKRS